MTDRDRPTGKHLRITGEHEKLAMHPSERETPRDPYNWAPGFEPPPRVDPNSDLGMLPALHRLLVGEVKDITTDIRGYIKPDIKRIADRLDMHMHYAQERHTALWSRFDALAKRVDGVDTKLDRVLELVERLADKKEKP